MKSYYKQWLQDGEIENILQLVTKWRGEGMEMNDIAKNLGISRASLFEYQSKYPDFADALKSGKEIADAKVENSLLKECIGYYYDETITTTTAIVDKATGQITSVERIETKTSKKYARPSPSAIAYYLNNRQPAKWKNKVVYDAENDDGIIASLVEAIKRERSKRNIDG